jgi:hypothetical protein
MTAGTADGVVAVVAPAGTATCKVGLGTNPAAGTYAGTLTYGDATNTATVPFSFTTAGKVATISSSVASVGLPAIAASSSTAFVVSKTVTYTLKDANGNVTQPAIGDTVTVAATGALASLGLQKTGSDTIAADLHLFRIQI